MSAARRFVLLCHQRSGSNALASVVEQHPRVSLWGQLFNDGLEYRRYLAHDLGMRLFRAHPRSHLHRGRRPSLRRRAEHAVLRVVPRERDLARHVERFFDAFGEPDDRAVGFKLHDLQLPDPDLRTLLEAHVDAVVLLHRRNLLRAAVSWATAVETDVWARRTGRDGAARQVVLDVEEVAWFRDKTAAQVARWRTLLADVGVPSVELTFEDHVLTGALDGLWALLGVAPPGDARPTTRRLSRPGHPHVRNAAEIDRALGADATGWLVAPGG